MVAVGLGILLPVISIVSLVLMIIVLIKQFSKGGVLQGLLGLITCGLWTFIWGWINHRNFNLKTIMMAWSACYVISIGVMAVAGTSAVTEITKLVGLSKGDLKAEIQKHKSPKANVRRKMKRPAPAAGVRKDKSGQNTLQGKTDGSNPQKLASAAMGLWQDGRYADPEQAVSNWTQVIQAQPNSAEAYNNRGVGHYNADRYFEAISDYDQAIRLKSNYAVAFNNRGNARYAMGNYQEALADYAASLRLNPRYATAHSNRGLAHYRINEQSQACEDFQKACELDDCEMMKWALSRQICK